MQKLCFQCCLGILIRPNKCVQNVIVGLACELWLNQFRFRSTVFVWSLIEYGTHARKTLKKGSLSNAIVTNNQCPLGRATFVVSKRQFLTQAK